MKITQLRHHLVRVPFTGALGEVVARDWYDMSLISELVTDDGLVGIAEMSQVEEIEEATSQIRWAEANLLGVDPLACDLHGVPQPWHLGLFDLAGKALGLPAWRLMGDKVRDRVTVPYWSLGQLGVAGTIREAELAGLRFWISTNPLGHGFGAAMMLHQYAVCPGATMSADILHYLRESSLTTDPLAPVNGELEVPEGPGLGVELDREALARYALEGLEVKG